MKKILLSIPLILLAATTVFADYYQWTDADGVVNFTDDLKKVPRQYRKKAKAMQLLQEPSDRGAEPLPAPPPASAPAPAKAAAPMFGDHDEAWWRQQFSQLRSDVDQARIDLPKKGEALREAQHKRAVYMRARDREEVNAIQNSINADEAKAAQAQKRLDDLTTEADRAGVPKEWRGN